MDGEDDAWFDRELAGCSLVDERRRSPPTPRSDRCHARQAGGCAGSNRREWVWVCALALLLRTTATHSVNGRVQTSTAKGRTAGADGLILEIKKAEALWAIGFAKTAITNFRADQLPQGGAPVRTRG